MLRTKGRLFMKFRAWLLYVKCLLYGDLNVFPTWINTLETFIRKVKLLPYLLSRHEKPLSQTMLRVRNQVLHQYLTRSIASLLHYLVHLEHSNTVCNVKVKVVLGLDWSWSCSHNFTIITPLIIGNIYYSEDCWSPMKLLKCDKLPGLKPIIFW